MKIRLDFVTNSSSVSYIVTLHPGMAEFRKFKTNNCGGDLKKLRIYEAIYSDIRKNGFTAIINGVEVLTRRYDFEKKTDCIYDTSFNDDHDAIDFSALSDNELWAYIYGEYLVNGKLSGELRGFGSVQVPRDEEKFREKRCKTVTCENCDRKDTADCFKINSCDAAFEK